jgi:hypothetical protein
MDEEEEIDWIEIARQCEEEEEEAAAEAASQAAATAAAQAASVAAAGQRKRAHSSQQQVHSPLSDCIVIFNLEIAGASIWM